MTAALTTSPERVALHLGRHARFEEHAFAALNTALFSDGAVVLVPKGVSVKTPLFIYHVSAASPPAVPSPPTVSCPRTLIVLEESASATVVETFAGSDGTFLTNAVSEAVLGPNSSLTHVRLQDEGAGTFHVSRLFLDHAAHAQSAAHLFSFGALLARNETVSLLGGEGAGTSLNGLFCAGGGQHVDNHTLIDHVAPRGTSQELYKGILGGRARGVFDGRIVVGTGATRTDAHQSNRNVILSAEALVDSKPQLEIYNNDVRCTHGSTTGRLDEDALFYLRSRGLGAEAARALLTFAFGSELVEKISDAALRAHLSDRLHGWLPSQERLPS
jgi:Fe-S cluster assembly protein SufD